MVANAAVGNVDLTDYAKKEDIPTDFLTEIPEDYIQESELKFATQEQIANLFKEENNNV